MNDCATEIPLNLSITNRLANSTETQKAKLEHKRRDGIYLTRSTIDPGTSLPQEKKLKIEKTLTTVFCKYGLMLTYHHSA